MIGVDLLRYFAPAELLLLKMQLALDCARLLRLVAIAGVREFYRLVRGCTSYFVVLKTGRHFDVRSRWHLSLLRRQRVLRHRALFDVMM